MKIGEVNTSNWILPWYVEIDPDEELDLKDVVEQLMNFTKEMTRLKEVWSEYPPIKINSNQINSTN